MTIYWLLLQLLLSSTISASSAPWQSAIVKNVLEEETFKDLPPIVFSGSGRLYSVEAMVAASVTMDDTSANLCVSVQCPDGVVILSTIPTSPHLDLEIQDEDYPLILDEEEQHSISTPCAKIAPGLYCATGGNAVDSQLLRDKIHQIATSLYESMDAGQLVSSSRVSASMVARHLADHIQRPTQTISAGSMLASSTIIVQWDHIWRVDPTGQFWKCNAACIGKGAGAAESYLIKHWNKELTAEKAVHMCCESIKSALPNMKHQLRGLILKKDGSIEILNHMKMTQRDKN